MSNFKEYYTEDVEIVSDANHATLWHGGRDLESGFREIIAHKSGRWEYGPGLYLTTHWQTATKYAKGSNKLYLVTIRKGTELKDVNLSLEVMKEFLMTHGIRKKAPEVLQVIEKNMSRTNKTELNGQTFVNILINYEAITNVKTAALRQFLINQGATYSTVGSFGGFHDNYVVVVIDPRAIIKVQQVRSKDVKGGMFVLPEPFTERLNEARTNPELNPKVSAVEQFVNEWEKLTDRQKIRSGLSMTSVDKIGVNPQSKFDTPVGIYAYPTEWVIKGIRLKMKDSFEKDNITFKSLLPYAGKSPYANLIVLKDNARILDLSQVGQLIDWEPLARKAAETADKISGTNLSGDIVERLIREAPAKALKDSDAGLFWYVTMKISEAMAEEASGKFKDKTGIDDYGGGGTVSGVPVMWNKLFRGMGYDVVSDPLGGGVIHGSEETQMFITHVGAIERVIRIENKVYKAPSFNPWNDDGKKFFLSIAKSFINAAKGSKRINKESFIEFMKRTNQWDVSLGRLNPTTLSYIVSNIAGNTHPDVAGNEDVRMKALLTVREYSYEDDSDAGKQTMYNQFNLDLKKVIGSPTTKVNDESTNHLMKLLDYSGKDAMWVIVHLDGYVEDANSPFNQGDVEHRKLIASYVLHYLEYLNFDKVNMDSRVKEEYERLLQDVKALTSSENS